MSPQLFTIAAGTSDALILEQLRFHQRARANGSWQFVEPDPPIIVTSRADGAELTPTPLTAELKAAALDAGVLSVRTERSRGYDFHSYHVTGLLNYDGRVFKLHGSSAHENMNHDFVSGSWGAREVFPVSQARAHFLANNALAVGEIQLAITLSHFARDPIGSLEQFPSREAADDIGWRVSRMGWTDVVVTKVAPMKKQCPYMAVVQGTVGAGAKSDAKMCAKVHGQTFKMTHVPRAGAQQLVG